MARTLRTTSCARLPSSGVSDTLESNLQSSVWARCDGRVSAISVVRHGCAVVKIVMFVMFVIMAEATIEVSECSRGQECDVCDHVRGHH
jgi:hypothetical protein